MKKEKIDRLMLLKLLIEEGKASKKEIEERLALKNEIMNWIEEDPIPEKIHMLEESNYRIRLVKEKYNASDSELRKIFNEYDPETDEVRFVDGDIFGKGSLSYRGGYALLRNGLLFKTNIDILS